MEAWVIKRKDGQYTGLDCDERNKIFTTSILRTRLYKTEAQAYIYIQYYNLQNCKPVKVRIEEVEE